LVAFGIDSVIALPSAGILVWQLTVELRRGQKFAQATRSRPGKLTAPLRRKIEAKLRQMRWSPEQISGWLCEQGIKLSHERVYQMI
jgi:IS30 family transposase